MVRIPRMAVVLGALILIGGMAQVYAADTQLPLNWSGPYIGAFAGSAWIDLDYYEPDYPGFERNPDIYGVTGGFLLGYNRRFDSMLVGVEADAGWGDFSEGPNRRARNSYSAFDIDWNTHVRARLGFVSDSTLFYAAGGLAFADVTVDDRDPTWGKDDATHVGWTVGVGIELAMTRNLQLRLEYLYDDYGSEDYHISGPVPYRAKVDLNANIIRVGLSYQF